MHPGHAGGFSSFDADGAVLEDHGVFRRDGNKFCGKEEGFGMRFSAFIVLGADNRLEKGADAEHIERGFDEFPMAIDEPR
jgi:hypothetical protein